MLERWRTRQITESIISSAMINWFELTVPSKPRENQEIRLLRSGLPSRAYKRAWKTLRDVCWFRWYGKAFTLCNATVNTASSTDRNTVSIYEDISRFQLKLPMNRLLMKFDDQVDEVTRTSGRSLKCQKPMSRVHTCYWQILAFVQSESLIVSLIQIESECSLAIYWS